MSTTAIQTTRVLMMMMLLVAMSGGINSQQLTQQFITRPSDTRVILGETAVLKCSVSIRHGDVQWVHEGTALGYDRKVPGKPRYSVTFNENEDVEYHLTIRNVTLDDEGVFSCQVAPIGDWDTKLEAKARLTVLVPPKYSPEIMFNDESKMAGDIVKFRTASLKTTKFNCTIRKSKPAAIIKWYLNDSLAGLAVGHSRETKISDGLLEDITSVFELKQQTNQVYNNSILRCQAFHESFGLNAQLPNMSIPLRLVLVYPPTTPVISGYDQQTGVAAGSDLNLVCSSQYTYPPAMLTWYRDGKVISKNYDTIASAKTTEAIYRIATVMPSDNKALFRCEAFNQAIDEPLTSPNVTLNVWFGPEKLTMNGSFEIEIGKPLSAVCFTEASNPAPSLRFNFDGVDFEPTSLTSSPIVSKPTNGAFVVNATFQLPSVKHEHNNKELKCYAENKHANIKQIVTKQIKVLYPPDSIDIVHSYDTNKLINDGTKVRLVCISRGGNPLPELEWFVDSKNKLQPTSSQSIVYTVESVLDVTLSRDFHQRAIECRSTNKAGVLTKNVTFSVSYLPSNVVISVEEPLVASNQLTNVVVKAGSRVVVSCRSSNSNPEPMITWFRDSYPILTNSIENQNISNQYLVKDFNSVSYMSFIASSSDHLKEIRCDVRVRDIVRTMHGSLTMEVKFAPELIKYPTSIIDVVENASFLLNLTSRANPAPNYKCSASNRRIYQVVNSTLAFIANRNDNSDFTCSISNTENQTDVFFKLNVKYSPSARINSTLHVVIKGAQIQIFCLLDGNPLLANHVIWKAKEKPLLTLNTEQFYSVKFIPPKLSVLTILNARDVDDGNVSCTVMNGIGKAETAYTELRVKRSPLVLEDESVLKAGEDSNLGRSARFKCTVSAYPDASFKWKTPGHADISNSSRYVVLYEKGADQKQSSTLIVYGVMSSDYGTYQCESRNEIGSLLAKAVLSGKHQPEQPSDFRVVNITKNSIALTWKKNFDGGETQKFRIRYRKDTMDPTYKYVETDDDVTSLTLDGLETATRYVINIQSLNKYGTEGFLREPLIVQTDFGFSNDVNQMPIFTGNDFPLTIILVICGSGTLFMLFNVAFIIYLIRKRKRKSEADSTTDTNETETNTVEMFSPPPPYPDELNYQLDLNGNNYEDENKPFVSNFELSNNFQDNSNKYYNYVADQMDYAIEYATPINQTNNWQKEQNDANEEIYLSSLKKINNNNSNNNAINNTKLTVDSNNVSGSSSSELTAGTTPSTLIHRRPDVIVSTFMNTTTTATNRSIPISASLNQNLSNAYTSVLDTSVGGLRESQRGLFNLPYEHHATISTSRQHLQQPQQHQQRNIYINRPLLSRSSRHSSRENNYNGSSTCRIYQDMDEYDQRYAGIDSTVVAPSSHRQSNADFKGHLV